MTPLRVFAICLACLLISWAPTIRAQDASADFEQARAKWNARDFAGALPLFERALTATGSPNARFYVARCLRDLGRLAEAHEQMQRTVDDARRLAEEEERYAATRDAAAAELAMLEPRVGKLIVALDDSLAGATVTVDDVPLPPERVGVPIAIMPGDVTVVARAGAARASQSAHIAAGETKTLALVAATPNAAPAAATQAPGAPAGDATGDGDGFGVIRGLGIGVAALGAGGMVMFAVGTLIADDKYAELEAACAGPCPDASHQPTIDEGKRAEAMAGIGLGIGIAGLVAGTLMIVFGGPDDEADAVAVTMTPHGLQLTF